jgi:hypothetical protein
LNVFQIGPGEPPSRDADVMFGDHNFVFTENRFALCCGFIPAEC